MISKIAIENDFALVNRTTGVKVSGFEFVSGDLAVCCTLQKKDWSRLEGLAGAAVYTADCVVTNLKEKTDFQHFYFWFTPIPDSTNAVFVSLKHVVINGRTYQHPRFLKKHIDFVSKLANAIYSNIY